MFTGLQELLIQGHLCSRRAWLNPLSCSQSAAKKSRVRSRRHSEQKQDPWDIRELIHRGKTRVERSPLHHRPWVPAASYLSDWVCSDTHAVVKARGLLAWGGRQ